MRLSLSEAPKKGFVESRPICFSKKIAEFLNYQACYQLAFEIMYESQAPTCIYKFVICIDIFSQSSFDFGPSFMDEVLKALNEKESMLETQNDKSSASSKEDRFDRSRSISPPKDVRSQPPPLPSQPPKLVSTEKPV